MKGLQLTDMVPHTLGLMLLDQLGLIDKMVKAGPNSGYESDLEIELGFELWASLRYYFLGGRFPTEVNSNEDLVVTVEDYALHIADSRPDILKSAARDRFGSQYLGCIH